MSEAPIRLMTVGAVIAATLAVLIALAPTLLFGESLSAMGLISTGALVLGAGMLVRRGSGAGARTLGTLLVATGTVILSVGVLALVVAVSGRGY